MRILGAHQSLDVYRATSIPYALRKTIRRSIEDITPIAISSMFFPTLILVVVASLVSHSNLVFPGGLVLFLQIIVMFEGVYSVRVRVWPEEYQKLSNYSYATVLRDIDDSWVPYKTAY